MKLIVFFMFLFISFHAWSEESKSTPPMAPEWRYTWRQLTESGVAKIKLRENGPRPLKSTPEETFKNLEVERTLLTEELPPSEPKKIAIVGDTGCRMKEHLLKNSYQNCREPKEWPFARIAARIAEEKPDLVIHAGDIHYREHCSKGHKCEKWTDVVGYGWPTWEADFFAPAKPALEAAPWLITRGNHEDCERGYLGYARTLARKTWKAKCEDYEETEYIALGGLLIVNFDTSSFEDSLRMSADDRALWSHRLKKIALEIKRRKPRKVWLLTHKPLYGFTGYGKTVVPATLVFRELFEATELKDKVDLIISGHLHVAEAVRSGAKPLQLVVGNSGTSLDEVDRAHDFKELKSFAYDLAFSGNSATAGFGYTILSRESDSWVADFKDVNGQSGLRCRIKDNRTAMCSRP